MSLGANFDDIVGDLGFLFSNALLQRTMVGESQFYQFESFYLPSTIKELFAFSAHAHLTNEVVNSAIEKVAEYPITSFLFEPLLKAAVDTPEYQSEMRSKQGLVATWEELFDDTLSAKPFAIKTGQHFQTYGNAFCSVYAPFDRILVCSNRECREEVMLDKANWTWDTAGLNFILKCRKCQQKLAARFYDKAVTGEAALSRLNLVSWQPSNIEIDFDPFSGQRDYYYTIPDESVKAIKDGNPVRLRHTPADMIEAVKQSRSKQGVKPRIRFHKNHIYHLARPGIDLPGVETPWGMPATVSVLRSIIYLNLMRRAQLALMMEHILPFRYLFPGIEVTSNSTINLDLGDWRRRMTAEIKKWKRDPLYIMLSPIPLGQGQMGGQGKALMLFNEMAQVKDDMIAGLNVPREFVYGGLTYSGSNVSLRMLENSLLNQVEQIEKMYRWVVKRIHAITGLEKVGVKMRRFKMADDIQMRQLMVGLWQGRAISGNTLGQEFGFDFATEMRKRNQEDIDLAIANAKAQAEAANRMMSLQSLLQNLLAPEFKTTVPSIDPTQVEQVYQGIAKLEPEAQANVLQQVAGQNPGLARQLQTRAMTDVSQYGNQLQTLLSMAPEQAQSSMQQMQAENPVMALILGNLIEQFNLQPLTGMSGGQDDPNAPGGATGGGANGKAPFVDKPMPNQKPPRRESGKSM